MTRLRTSIEALALAGVVRVALRLLPVRRLLILLDAMPRTRSVETAGECAALGAKAAGRAAHGTCLYSALTTYGLLARRGYAPRLVIGTRRAPAFAAHAWVSVDGAAVEPSAHEYAPLWASGASCSGVR